MRSTSRQSQSSETELLRVLGLEDARHYTGTGTGTGSLSSAVGGTSEISSTVGGAAAGSDYTGAGSERGDGEQDDRSSDDGRSSISAMSLYGGAVAVGMTADGADMMTTGLTQISVLVNGITLRGLKTSSFFGAANPYVAISLGPHREKTPVKWSVR